MTIDTDTLIRWSFTDFDKPLFLSAIAKVYKELNKVGFSAKMELTREELDVFNDFVEQVAADNSEQS